MKDSEETVLEKKLLKTLEISQQRIETLDTIRHRKDKKATDAEYLFLKENPVPPLSNDIIALILAAKADKRKKKGGQYKPFLLRDGHLSTLIFRYKLEELIAQNKPFHYDCIIKKEKGGHCTPVQFEFDANEFRIFYIEASNDASNFGYISSFKLLHRNTKFYRYTQGGIQADQSSCSIFSLQYLNTLSNLNLDQKKHIATAFEASDLEHVFLKNIQRMSSLKKSYQFFTTQTINKKKNITLKKHIEQYGIYVNKSKSASKWLLGTTKRQNHAIAYKIHKYLQAAHNKLQELKNNGTDITQFIAEQSNCNDKNILSDEVDHHIVQRMLQSYIKQKKINAILALLFFAMQPEYSTFTRDLLSVGIGKTLIEVVDWLHKNGADLKTLDVEGNHLLITAAYFGHADVIEKLCQLGLDVNMPRQDGCTAVAFAIQQTNVDVLNMLKKLGVDFNKQMPNGFPPAVSVVKKGDLNTIKWLKSWGLDFYIQAADGVTPIFMAAQNGRHEIVSFLLADPRGVSVPFISTAADLKIFAKMHNAEVIKRMDDFILSNSIPASDKIMMLPKDIAMIMGYQNIVELFDSHDTTLHREETACNLEPAAELPVLASGPSPESTIINAPTVAEPAPLNDKTDPLISMDSQLTKNEPITQKNKIDYAFLLACMAHQYTRRFFTACIIIGAIIAILSLSGLTGPAGLAALATTLGVTGTTIFGGGIALCAGSLFACNASKVASTDENKNELPNNKL